MNLPNKITVSRIVLAFLFMAAIYTQWYIAAAVTFIVVPRMLGSIVWSLAIRIDRSLAVGMWRDLISPLPSCKQIG